MLGLAAEKRDNVQGLCSPYTQRGQTTGYRIIHMLGIVIRRLLKRKGKAAFLSSVVRNGTVMDVGCGNNSPRRFKTQRPDISYIGLDIGDYNQSAETILFANSYVITSPDTFVNEITKREGKLDAVVSSHNIEHCDRPEDVLKAMLRALRVGGRIYLSFPCEESVRFPKRRGTLNFYDDATHKTVPDYDYVCALVKSEGLHIEFAARRYRPFVLMAIGLLLEPLAAILRRNMPAGSTWALYGFESVIWASRPTHD